MVREDYTATISIVLLTVAGSEFNRLLVQAGNMKSVQPRKGAFGSTFPGTLWCGPGDTAKNRNSLGKLKNVDKCCRYHDSCTDVIPKFGKKYGIFNPTLSPKYNCICDENFKSCLSNVPRWENQAAEFIGSLYFESRIFPFCFKHDYLKKCVEKSKSVPWRCEEYENVSSKNKTWQWLDYGKWFTDFTAG